MVTRTSNNGGCRNRQYSKTSRLFCRNLVQLKRSQHWSLSCNEGELTEHSSRSIITGETGLTHSGTMASVSLIFIMYCILESRGYRSWCRSETCPTATPLPIPQPNPSKCGSLPIVNDECCDFFCRLKMVSAGVQDASARCAEDSAQLWSRHEDLCLPSMAADYDWASMRDMAV
jgi:hypothetical protein